MTRANQDVRKAARGAGVPLWMIASKIGVTEVTMSRWLRRPLPEDKKSMILGIIAELEQEVV